MVNLIEDKTFDLMSKMYTEMNLKFDEINIKLDKKTDKSDIVRIEDKLENKTKVLFDGYSQTYEKLTNIEKKLEDISTKVEKQDIEIRVIKNIAN
ncbi:MAG: arsenate reductase-like glutaredoxin family protein [Clostridium sp.]